MLNPPPEKIREIIGQCIEMSPIDSRCEVDVRYNEPMSVHTTFKTGGPADIWLRPHGDSFPAFCAELIHRVRGEGIPVFILGGGANVVVSDKGIRGIVLDMGAWEGESIWSICAAEGELVFKSGTVIDDAVDIAAASGLGGLEFLAGMPGTVGGAVWMNARCYGKEMADVLSWVEIVDFGSGSEAPEIKRIAVGDSPEKAGFDYKKSPFQGMDCLILSAAFRLKKRGKEKSLVEMEKYRQDRQDKGHYLFPCAGSAFKNNRDFGKPTGQIIDELGLKSFQIGGAQIAPFHGNIVINAGGASSADIRALMDEVAAKVKAATGFTLEPEILFAGEW
jgi:UDP-N-acetylmuramate dehydrogenase